MKGKSDMKFCLLSFSQRTCRRHKLPSELPFSAVRPQVLLFKASFLKVGWLFVCNAVRVWLRAAASLSVVEGRQLRARKSAQLKESSAGRTALMTQAEELHSWQQSMGTFIPSYSSHRNAAFFMWGEETFLSAALQICQVIEGSYFWFYELLQFLLILITVRRVLIHESG